MTKSHHLVERALAFAGKAHAGVVRKYTGEPYVRHVERVAARIAALGFGPEVIAAAALHDVVEDTSFTASDLASAFGPAVAALVLEVTKPTDRTGDRATRKGRDLVHFARASPAGASIKLADMLDNSSNVAAVDPKFAALYLAEARLLLAVLGHGHPALVSELTTHLKRED